MNSLIKALLITLPFIPYSEAKPYFTLGYGLGSYQDETKEDVGFKATGSPMKFAFGMRSGHLELETFFRVANYKGDITHDGVSNEIKHSEKSYGVGLGLYAFPFLRFNLGYAVHQLNETLGTTVGEIETQEIKRQYSLQDGISAGPYLGADFHLFSIYGAKLMFSGTAYMTSGNGGKSYEGLMNIKIPFQGFDIGSSSN